MRVRCPICSEWVEGEGENDLSLNLQAHMASEHGFKSLCRMESTPRILAENECRETPSGELASLTYGERQVIEPHREEGQVFPGEDVMESVRCPVCGRVLLGHAEDDLSYNLARHLNFTHEVDVSWAGKG